MQRCRTSRPRARRPRSSGNEEPRTFASNNWAVAPRRSATGDALLAGDPHLELSLPSIWYEAQLVVPGTLDVYGVTIPGLPAIILGFNRDIAWTFTNTGADVLDFYTEKVDQDAHPTKYFVDGAWRPLEQRIEQYRGQHGEILAVDTLYFTHRGPLRRENGQWLSMRWTVLDQSNETEGFRLAAKAKDVDEFQRAMGMYFRSPAQNMLVADRHGSIAIRSTGRFPIRPAGGSGFTIRDGTTSASDWRSYLPVEFAPQARDPEQGYLASANQQPIDPRMAKYWFGGQYETWRAMRINQLLRADSAVTVDKMRRFQTDPGSAFADLFVPYFLNAAQRAATHPVPDVDAAKLAEAARLLGEWDRKYTKDNKRAVLFDLAYVELVNRTWDELIAPGPSARGGIRRVVTPSSEVLAELLADSTSEWWDDRRTSRRETRDDILAASLAAALDTARARYGDPAKKGWTWSRVRHVNIWHPLRLPSLSALDLPTEGGRGTLNPSSGAGIFGPSWRMVVELSSTELKAWGTYPGGQSGNPASSRYTNHLPGVGQRGPRAPPHAKVDSRTERQGDRGAPNAEGPAMTRSQRSRPRRPLPFAALACGGLVVLGAWLIGWWIVPLAALITTIIWWERADIAMEVMWGAVGGWVLLLLIDSLHGRTWALARAAGGVLFLPWGLLFPVTLLFAAGLAWSMATVAQAACARTRKTLNVIPRFRSD